MAKLVRDKVPERMAADECTAVTRDCHDDEEYQVLLLEKLVEEAKEVRAAHPIREHLIEELADLVEVIETVKLVAKISSHDIERARLEKLETHGGFTERHILFE